MLQDSRVRITLFFQSNIIHYRDCHHHLFFLASHALFPFSFDEKSTFSPNSRRDNEEESACYVGEETKKVQEANFSKKAE
jgi:hypothetical protein